jgi:signal peptidase
MYYVATESMYPTIKPYSLITVRETAPEKLEVGDVISFISRQPEIYGMVNTHRIYEITEDEDGQMAFVTMGDNNPVPDSYYVYPDEIVGKVVAHTPPLKALTEIMSFAGTRTGFFIVIILPLILIAGIFLNSFIQEFRASLQKEAQQLDELHRQSDEQENAKQLMENYFGKTYDEISDEDIRTFLDDIGKESADGAEQSTQSKC